VVELEATDAVEVEQGDEGEEPENGDDEVLAAAIQSIACVPMRAKSAV
jgi:hypothetical protein